MKLTESVSLNAKKWTRNINGRNETAVKGGRVRPAGDRQIVGKQK